MNDNDIPRPGTLLAWGSNDGHEHWDLFLVIQCDNESLTLFDCQMGDILDRMSWNVLRSGSQKIIEP